MSSRYSPDPAKKYILSILAAPTAITVDLKVFIWLSSLTRQAPLVLTRKVFKSSTCVGVGIQGIETTDMTTQSEIYATLGSFRLPRQGGCGG